MAVGPLFCGALVSVSRTTGQLCSIAVAAAVAFAPACGLQGQDGWWMMTGGPGVLGLSKWTLRAATTPPSCDRTLPYDDLFAYVECNSVSNQELAVAALCLSLAQLPLSALARLHCA
jgi:hypothetical protein